MKFGENLKKLRSEKGMTQKEVAEQFNVTAQAVSRWEKGEVEPSLQTILVIADFFEVTVDELLGVEKQEEISDIDIKNESTIDQVDQISDVKEGNNVDENIVENTTTEEPLIIKRTISEEEQKKIAKQKALRLEKIRREQQRVQERNEINKHFFISLVVGVIAAVLAGIIAHYSLVPYVEGLPEVVQNKVPQHIYWSVPVIVAVSASTLVGCLILENNFLGSMIITIFKWGFLRMPGVIFSLDLEGIIWLITVKLFLWVLGFIIALAFGMFAITLGLALSLIVYPIAVTMHFKEIY